MSLFDRVKEVGKKALEEAKRKSAEIQLQREKADLLGFLSKEELVSVALDYDVAISKDMTKEDIIDELSKNSRLTKKTSETT